VAGCLSLLLWAGIVIAGRMIAYNWFDCDRQPQPAIINFAEGCRTDSRSQLQRWVKPIEALAEKSTGL
jgi:hypothetical protein